MKKNAIATILSLVLAMSLAACGGKKEETASNAASTEATTKAEEKKQEPVVAATTEEEPVEEEIVEETPAMLPLPADTILLIDGTEYVLYPTKMIVTPSPHINPNGKGLYVQLDFDFDPTTRTVTCVQTNSPVEDAPANILDYTDVIGQWDEAGLWENGYVPLNLLIPGQARGIYDATVYGTSFGDGEGDVIYDLYPADEARYEAFKASNSGDKRYDDLMYGTITATYTFPEQEMKPFDIMENNSYYHSLPDLNNLPAVHRVVFGATEYPVDNTKTFFIDGAIEYVPQNE